MRRAVIIAKHSLVRFIRPSELSMPASRPHAMRMNRR